MLVWSASQGPPEAQRSNTELYFFCVTETQSGFAACFGVREQAELLCMQSLCDTSLAAVGVFSLQGSNKHRHWKMSGVLGALPSVEVSA